MLGGGQVHLANVIRELESRIFAGLSPRILFRFSWTLYVIPQVVFHHFFRRKFSLIHAHSIPAMVAGKILSVILGVPVVVTVHGSNMMDLKKLKVETRLPDGQGGKLKVSWWKYWLEKWVLTKVKYDAQITVARNFLKYENVNQNVIYIPNGVDLEKFAILPGHDKRVVEAKRSRSIANFQSAAVLFVGRRDDPVKGFGVLEQAMRRVRKEILGVKLLVAGGDLSKKQVIKMYHQADLFILPSLSEGFPLTLLEAWAAKLAVIATAVGEVPRLVKDGENGYLVPPGNPRMLAGAIIKALQNKNLAKLGRNGYNLARSYSWRKTAQKTLQLYRKIC